MTSYFDNAATTRLCGAAANAFTEAALIFANPSSLHSAGLEAEKLVSASRKKLLSIIGGAGKGDLIFTGCGTESNATAIFGTAYAKRSNAGKNIIISDSEHPSVYKNAEALAARGFAVRRVGTKGGRVDPEELHGLTDENTFLISVMTVNNETGALYDIKELCAAAKRKNPSVLFHTDATQAFMKTDVNVSKTGVDLMTVSAHKIGGPKGVGALFVKDGVIRSRSLSPLMYGGGQEGGLRSGTENTAGIAAFAAAAEYGKENFDTDIKNARELSSYIKRELSAAGVRINEPYEYIPHIICATLPGIKSEVMLHFLSSKGIFISSGSACSSHHRGVSSAMTSFGLTEKEADCTVRISIFRENTADMAVHLVEGMREGLSGLIKMYK